MVTGVEDGVEHGFVEEAISHPFGNDDVDLGNIGMVHVFDAAVEAPE